MDIQTKDDALRVLSEIKSEQKRLAEANRDLNDNVIEKMAADLKDAQQKIAEMAAARLRKKMMGSFFDMGGSSGGIIGGLAQAALSFVPGGNIFGSLFTHGGSVARASYGLMIPGSTGHDRTMVLAKGGEGILSHDQMNHLRQATRQPTQGRGRFFGPAAAPSPVHIESSIILNRPMSVTEQITLVGSQLDAATIAERYMGE